MVTFFKAIAYAPSTPGKFVKYLKVGKSTLQYLEAYNNTSATLNKFSRVFPNLGHFVNDGNGGRDQHFSFHSFQDDEEFDEEFQVEEFDLEVYDPFEG